jgi:hypothetical protein
MLRLNMIDRTDFSIAGLATLSGWGAASKLMAFWVAMGPWARLTLQSVLQGLITLLIGLGALTANHYWRRYLNKRAPISDAPGQTRFDVFDLFRRGISSLRKLKGSRKES